MCTFLEQQLVNVHVNGCTRRMLICLYVSCTNGPLVYDSPCSIQNNVLRTRLRTKYEHYILSVADL